MQAKRFNLLLLAVLGALVAAGAGAPAAAGSPAPPAAPADSVTLSAAANAINTLFFIADSSPFLTYTNVSAFSKQRTNTWPPDQQAMRSIHLLYILY